MRRADAPPSGWYPDPQNRSRLRWWDGLDWTDARRAVPSDAELIAAEAIADAEQLAALGPPDSDLDWARTANRSSDPSAAPRRRRSRPRELSDEQAQIIDEVRNATRAEIDYAAQQFSQRADAAVRNLTPLVSEYSSRLLSWIRRAVIIAIVLLVAYFVFQVVVQASLFEWIGDRIDALTSGSAAGSPR